MTLLPYPKFKATDAEGLPLNGGKLYTYRAGTTTAKEAYSDGYLTTAHTNPIILDTNGECELYLSGKYKLILRDADDTLLWTMDNISGIEGFERYYIDSTETDQGAVGGGYSVKDLVDYIGANNATIILSHVAGGSSTTYTFTTGLTIPSNITLKVDPGALISVASGKTLTINGPFDFPYLKQVFSGTGTVTFGTNAVVQEYEQWSGYSTTNTMSIPVLMRNHLSGLEMTIDADADHDISIATGVCADSTNTKLFYLSSALVKQIDGAWAVGSNKGGLFSGTSPAVSTWYHVFLIRKTSDGTIDAGFDTSLTAANRPSGYDTYRRIGSIVSNSSSNIAKFVQHGDDFTWDIPPIERVNAAVGSTSAVTLAINAPPDIVTKVKLLFGLTYYSGGTSYLLVTSLDQTDTTPSMNANDLSCAHTGIIEECHKDVYTNTSRQIRWRVSNLNLELYILNFGYTDTRGK